MYTANAKPPCSLQALSLRGILRTPRDHIPPSITPTTCLWPHQSLVFGVCADPIDRPEHLRGQLPRVRLVLAPLLVLMLTASMIYIRCRTHIDISIFMSRIDQMVKGKVYEELILLLQSYICHHLQGTIDGVWKTYESLQQHLIALVCGTRLGMCIG